MRELENLEEAKKAMIEKINQSKDDQNIILIIDSCSYTTVKTTEEVLSILDDTHKESFSKFYNYLEDPLFGLIKTNIKHYLEQTKEDPKTFYKRLRA